MLCDLTGVAERDGAFSPDGNWIAYETDESGQYEIYVQPFPPTGAKWKVSKNRGIKVKWRRDGKELFFVSGGTLMAVDVKLGASFEAGAPQPLFDAFLTSSFAKRWRPPAPRPTLYSRNQRVGEMGCYRRHPSARCPQHFSGMQLLAQVVGGVNGVSREQLAEAFGIIAESAFGFPGISLECGALLP